MMQPQNSRGVIGEQHGLTRLTTALESIEAGQRSQQTRDSQLQAQLTRQAAVLAQTQYWLRMVLGGVGLLVVLTLGLLGVGGWQAWHPPDMAYARALGALDSALVQQWNTLPKTTQEQLTTVYGRLGLASPGERALKK
jgi:uncharacterized coiled-coil protein SlyX